MKTFIRILISLTTIMNILVGITFGLFVIQTIIETFDNGLSIMGILGSVAVIVGAFVAGLLVVALILLLREMFEFALEKF